jgi:hypothetical protein
MKPIISKNLAPFPYEGRGFQSLSSLRGEVYKRGLFIH